MWSSSKLAVLMLVSTGFVAACAQTMPSGYESEMIATGLSLPTTMAFINENEFLVLEKNTGNVRYVQLPGPTTSNALTLTVDPDSERGLLGITLHPNFDSNNWVYLYYTNASPLENRVERYTWTGTTLTTPTSIIDLPATPGPNHDGGIITFGPDGKLYIIIGDLNRDHQTQNYVDADMSDSGVILRLNDDGSTPSDNPFTIPGWEKYYAYGIRNSFGMAFDPLTGTLWDTENGPANYDEINRVPPGFNSGWIDIMGPDSRDPQGIGDLVMIPGANYVDPQFSWLTTIAPTGICFLNSIRWPASLRDDCYVGDTNTGSIYRFDLNPGRTAFVFSEPGLLDAVADSTAERLLVQWVTNFNSITDVRVGPDGYLYVVSLGNGSIYRLRPINPMGDLNLDGAVSLDDIAIFTSVLLGQVSDPQFITLSDFDGDGLATGLDIQGFTQSLLLPN